MAGSPTGERRRASDAVLSVLQCGERRRAGGVCCVRPPVATAASAPRAQRPADRCAASTARAGFYECATAPASHRQHDAAAHTGPAGDHVAGNAGAARTTASGKRAARKPAARKWAARNRARSATRAANRAARCSASCPNRAVWRAACAANRTAWRAVGGRRAARNRAVLGAANWTARRAGRAAWRAVAGHCVITFGTVRVAVVAAAVLARRIVAGDSGRASAARSHGLAGCFACKARKSRRASHRAGSDRADARRSRQLVGDGRRVGRRAPR